MTEGKQPTVTQNVSLLFFMYPSTGLKFLLRLRFTFTALFLAFQSQKRELLQSRRVMRSFDNEEFETGRSNDTSLASLRDSFSSFVHLRLWNYTDIFLILHVFQLEATLCGSQFVLGGKNIQ